ncbi:MAG TPA: hypothetical protein VJ305_23860, partial [Streptosporangiaceae bacterium]|nr:hypothetical protein [Streptosporangiaceae bacterium]
LADHPRWSAWWDKKHGLWRVAEDDPDSDLYAESSDADNCDGLHHGARPRVRLTSIVPVMWGDLRRWPATDGRITDQGRSSPGSRSLPFFDRSGSVHAERLKQQGRLFPLFIFEMLTSTRRLRVSGFFVALTQRTHSHRAIGVVSFHTSWIFCGAAARAAARSGGTLGSGQSLVTSISTVAS